MENPIQEARNIRNKVGKEPRAGKGQRCLDGSFNMASLQQICPQIFVYTLKMSEHVKSVVDPVFDFCWFQISQQLNCKEIVFANLKR